MFVIEGSIAKKYARAFVGIYTHILTASYIKRLEALQIFLEKNKFFQATLSIPSISLEIKQEFIERVSRQLGLTIYTKKLMLVLLHHGRIELLGRVLKKIILLYKQQRKEEHFTVSSSHILSSHEQDSVISFLVHKVDASISVSFIKDKSLICGLQAKSDNHFWECSVRKRIQQCKRLLLRR